MNGFDINIDLNAFEEIDFDFFGEKRYSIQKSKINKTKKVSFKYAKQFAKEIEIEKDTRYYAYIDGSFIFGDFIIAFLGEKKIKGAKITLSSLSLSEDNIGGFAAMIKLGFISELNIVISDYFYSHERNNLIRLMYKMLDIENKFQLAVCKIHTKITMIEYDDKKVVISGSANLRTSGTLEQVTVEENSELFDFNKTVHDKIINEFKTINKAVSTKQLWNLIK
jgi:hypothetical protein